MAETELPRVKHLAKEISGAFAGVKFVAEDWVPEIVKVDADLVGAATVQNAFDQAHVAARTQNAIIRFRRSSLTARDTHALPMNRVALDCFVDDASSLSRSPGHESQIDFSHGAGGKLFGKIAVSRVVLGNDKRAAGFFVEPMHDAGPFLSADRREILAMGQERVDQRMRLMTRPRMHNEPSRFVENEEIAVLEKDLERHRLGLRIALFNLGFAHFDNVAGVNGVARSRLLPIHVDESLADQCLEADPREGGERQSESAIEPLSCLFA